MNYNYTHHAKKLLVHHKYKLTQQRLAVIDVLNKNTKPLSAYQIKEQSSTAIDVATVYRTLELFESLGFTHKIRSVDGYIKCQLQDNHHCHHYAVCTECHDIIEMQKKHDHQHNLPKKFNTKNEVFEVTGKCNNCK